MRVLSESGVAERSDFPAWKRLIERPLYPLSTAERISLITSIFSDRDEVKVVSHLPEDDAQAFIDAIDGASLRTFSSPKNRPVDWH